MSNFRRLAAQLIDFPETQTINYKAMKKLSIDNTNSSDNKIIYHSYHKKTKEGTLVFTKDILEINSTLFTNNRFLLEITLPNCVLNINNAAFKNCVNLKNVNININTPLQNIGDSAFENCKSLNHINLPDTIANIGIGGFKNCINLKNVILPKNITEISESCFENCDSFTFIDIPEGVIKINSNAFNIYNKIDVSIPTTINRIVLPNTLIGYNHYFNNIYIKDLNKYMNIDIKDKNNASSTKRCVCKNIYLNNELLTHLNLTTTSGYNPYIFGGCESIEEISFPTTEFTLSFYFTNCINLKKLNNFENCTSTYYAHVFENTGFITFDLSNFTEIIGGILNGCKKLETVILSENTTIIKFDAFKNCIALKNITLPETLTEISSQVFYGCTSLENIEIPKNVTNIGYGAFENCENLINVTIQNNINISRFAFKNCKNLTNINIEYINGLNSSVFEGCENLKNVTLNENVTYLDEGVFSGCKNLISINTENITTMHGTAFNDCEKLSNIVLNNECVLDDSSYGTFVNCRNLTITLDENNPNYVLEEGVLLNKDKTTILCHANPNAQSYIIPESVISIANYAFSGRNIQNVILNDTIDIVPKGAFKNCKNLLSFDFKNCTYVYDEAFSGCINLSNIIFTKNINFGINVFAECNITTFTIPEGVTYIDICAFSNIKSLENIIIPTTLEDIDDYKDVIPFENTNIKNIYISDLKAFYSISFDIPIFKYAENLYLNNELVTDITIESNTNGAFDFYKKLKNVHILENVRCHDFGGLDNINITLEKELDITSYSNGMGFTEDGCLFTTYRPGYNPLRTLLNTNISKQENLTLIAYVDYRKYAFINNKLLKKIIIPFEAGTDLGLLDLEGCDNVNYIYIKGPLSRFGAFDKDIFKNLPNSCLIVIEDEYFDDYFNVGSTDYLDRFITITELNYFNEIQ